MNRSTHWNNIHGTKAPDQVSWFQAEPALSLELIQQAAPARDSSIIDVGAGASTLVDALLRSGYHRITVLDISAAALASAQHRIANVHPDEASTVIWRNDDLLTATLPTSAFDVWHDRAAFHFLTDPADRARYREQLRHAVRPGGHVIVATFAEDGPTKCSGLDVVRYSPATLRGELGDDFKLADSRREEHHTPWGATQLFTYCLFEYEPGLHRL